MENDRYEDEADVRARPGDLRGELDRGGVLASVKRADDMLVRVVREHPVGSLLVALAFGYAVGRVLSSRG